MPICDPPIISFLDKLSTLLQFPPWADKFQFKSRSDWWQQQQPTLATEPKVIWCETRLLKVFSFWSSLRKKHDFLSLDFFSSYFDQFPFYPLSLPIRRKKKKKKKGKQRIWKMSFKTNIVCLATVAFLVLLLDPRFVSSQSTTARTNRVRQALVVRRQRPLTGDTPSSSTANTTTSTSTSEEPEKEEPDESEERQLSKSQSNGRTSRQTEKSLGRKNRVAALRQMTWKAGNHFQQRQSWCWWCCCWCFSLKW